MLIIPPKLYLDKPIARQDFLNFLNEFELQESSVGLQQVNIKFDYFEVYKNQEWITPAPQNKGFYFDTNLPRVEQLKKSLESFPRKNNQSLKVLEIGGGNIVNSKIAAEYDFVEQVVSIDPGLRNEIIEQKLTCISGFFPENLQRNENFDFIFSFNTIEHVNNVEFFIQKIKHKLKPQGKVLISAPECTRQIFEGDWNLLTQQHISYFTQSGLIQIFYFFNFSVESIFQINDEIFILFKLMNDLEKTGKLTIDNKVNLNLFLNHLENKLKRFDNLIKDINQKNMLLVAHGASSGILNLVANSKYYEELTKNLIILDSDPSKHGKYLTFFQIPITSPENLKIIPNLVLIGSSTFEKSISEFWRNSINCEFWSV